MRPGPAIAWTVAGAAITAGLLEMLPASGPPPTPMTDALHWALDWLLARLGDALRLIHAGVAAAGLR